MVTPTSPTLIGGVAIVAACGILAMAATGGITRMLHKHAILDRPNNRSLHSVPTPRGGGWGLLLGTLPGWIYFDLSSDGSPFVLSGLLAGLLLLVAISWQDDRVGVSALARLIVQGLAVTIALLPLDANLLTFQGWLPAWLDRPLTAIAWVWFINLYNFMDGIDGIAACEAISLGIGTAAVLAVAGPATSGFAATPWQGLTVAAAALGFLVWNWHPARVFLGDVGSVPLGFLSGWLLLCLAISGAWVAAILLALVFWADATLTLLRRASRGKTTLWEAHREHAYQVAVQAGWRHDRVVLCMLCVNAFLLLVAISGTWAEKLAASAALAAIIRVVALSAGVGATLLFLWQLQRQPKGQPPSPQERAPTGT